MLKISLNNYSVYQEIKGSQLMQLNNGYKELIDIIVAKHEDDFNSRLKLNHVLKKILVCSNLIYPDDQECEHCKFTDDTNKLVLLIEEQANNEEIKELTVLCENVVCTMSLGYLKENLRDLIEPKNVIPDEKLEAVSRLGFGTVNKVILIQEYYI